MIDFGVTAAWSSFCQDATLLSKSLSVHDETQTVSGPEEVCELSIKKEVEIARED